MSVSLRALCLVFGIFCAGSGIRAEENIIRIAADPWCPFNCQPGGEHQGFMIDIAREALALNGYELRYAVVNWARAKFEVQNGQLEGLVGISKSPKSEKVYRFPKTVLGRSQICFFRPENSQWSYSGVPSLEGIRFGWINDYGYGNTPGLDEWVREKQGTYNVVTISGQDAHSRLFSLMRTNRIDTFAEDRNVIAYELKKAGLLGQIRVAGCVSSVDSVYVAFNKDHQNGEAWAAALDQGVKVLDERGDLDKILHHYGLSKSEWLGQ